MPSPSQQRLLDLIRTEGAVRARDLDSHGIAREQLRRLQSQGLVEQVGRGLYRLADVDASEHQSLAEASKKVPLGVVCLLSALRFHGLTTQNPFEVWIAIERKARRPKTDGLPIRIVRFSGLSLVAGVEEHSAGGTRIRVYSPAKTVADCFKYRNKIGVDVAVEALRECAGSRRCSFDDLWAFAKICRVANVMRPYLESAA